MGSTGKEEFTLQAAVLQQRPHASWIWTGIARLPFLSKATTYVAGNAKISHDRPSAKFFLTSPSLIKSFPSKATRATKMLSSSGSTGKTIVARWPRPAFQTSQLSRTHGIRKPNHGLAWIAAISSSIMSRRQPVTAKSPLVTLI